MAIRKAPPAGWEEWAPLEGDRQLMKRFHLAGATITRLRRETGLYRVVGHINKKRELPADFAEKAKWMHKMALRRHYEAPSVVIDRWCKEAGVTPPPGKTGFQPTTVATMPFIRRDTTLAGRCASFLQKKDAIYRCDQDGRPTIEGRFFFWLQRVRTEQFIIDTATRKGFDPCAWERLAA